MWLINTTSLELEYFQTCPAGTYAILSHTWGPDKEELSLEEFKAGEGRKKLGFYKIRKCCSQALEDGLQYAWVDTCCIDKRSSAELSEAINSMFAWYASAKVCYAYLSDVSRYDPLISQENPEHFCHSRWFTRGWTLQELIAPQTLSFYTEDWTWFGDKSNLAQNLQVITGVDMDVLQSRTSFRDRSIAQRMSWASQRQTTRLEDSAYCLLGLFDANIPLLYGEGPKAFLRLQHEIIRHTDDDSIFAWSGVDEGGSGLLAPSVSHFADAADIVLGKQSRERPPFTYTNRGLSIELDLLPCEMSTYAVPLRCCFTKDTPQPVQVVIFVCQTLNDKQCRRVPFHGHCRNRATVWDMSDAKSTMIFIPEDGRGLQLAPHSGYPRIHVSSELRIWHLYRHDSDSRVDVQGNSLTSPTNDLEHLSSGTSTWNPTKTADILFRSSDLKRGVIIALRRRYTTNDSFDYYLQIGWDRDFNPKCDLHAKRFKVTTWFGQLCLQSDRLLGLRRSWWTHGPETEYESLAEHLLLTSCVKSHVQRQIVSAVVGGLIRLLPALYKTKSSRSCTIAGDNVDGFKWKIDDQLPPSYGCTNFAISFHPTHGLDWELSVHEQPFHSNGNQRQACCWKSRLISVGKQAVGDDSVSISSVIFKVIMVSLTVAFVAWLSYPFLPFMFDITNSQGFGLACFIIAESLTFTVAMTLLWNGYLLMPRHEASVNNHRIFTTKLTSYG